MSDQQKQPNSIHSNGFVLVAQIQNDDSRSSRISSSVAAKRSAFAAENISGGLNLITL